MAEKTGIEWTTSTWNPLGAKDTTTGKKGWFCTRVAEGCRFCYAEAVNKRVGNGLEYRAQNERNVEWYLKSLHDPISKWKDGRYIFTNSMTDIFHKDVPFEFMDTIYAVMALTQRHTYQNLTKRPEIRKNYLSVPGVPARVFEKAAGIARSLKIVPKDYPFVWPLPNVWEGVSISNQEDADRDLPLLLNTPAALRWVSYEPAIGPVDFENLHGGTYNALDGLDYESIGDIRDVGILGKGQPLGGLDWIVVGGESGPKARMFDVEWARSTMAQCRAARVPVFVKQLGAMPFASVDNPLNFPHIPTLDKKGGKMEEWPEDLQVREMPEVSR